MEEEDKYTEQEKQDSFDSQQNKTFNNSSDCLNDDQNPAGLNRSIGDKPAGTPDKPIKQTIKRNVFKENWLKVDETCPGCGQITKRQRGMTKQNLMRMVKPKFDANEILITAMLVLVLLLALAYNSETKQCREWLTSMAGDSVEECKWNCNLKCDKLGVGPVGQPSEQYLNGTLLNLNESNELYENNELNGYELLAP
jgi:hypothetical protein